MLDGRDSCVKLLWREVGQPSEAVALASWKDDNNRTSRNMSSSRYVVDMYYYDSTKQPVREAVTAAPIR